MREQALRLRSARWILAALFIIGALLGCVTARLIPASIMQTIPRPGCERFVSASIGLSWCALTALFLAFSTLGTFLIPLLAALRGFLLAHSAAAAMLAGDDPRFMVALALPALFAVPAFFLVCEDSLIASRMLLACSRSGMTERCAPCGAARAVTAAVLFLLGAGLRCYFIP